MQFTRRTVLGAAATAALCPQGACLAGERALSRSGDRHPRSELREISSQQRRRRTHRHRHALLRGAGLVRRSALRAVERHPERSHHAMGRGDRCGVGLPQARELSQRADPRPPGPAADLRAWRAAGHAHRIRRLDHRHPGSLGWQAAQFAERHRREIRQLDLVHRSGRSASPSNYLGNVAKQELPTNRVPDRQVRPRDRGRRRHQSAERARVLARRVEALHPRKRRQPPGHPRLRRGRRREARERPSLHHHARRGKSRRLPRRCRRQPVVRMGHAARRSTA